MIVREKCICFHRERFSSLSFKKEAKYSLTIKFIVLFLYIQEVEGGEMIARSFRLSEWQDGALRKLSKSGINSSQLVRIGIGIVFDKINSGQKVADLVHEHSAPTVPIERGILTKE